MTNSPNFWPVYDRLTEASELLAGVPDLVEAALTGQGALDALLAGRPTPGSDPSTRPAGGKPRPPEAFLTRLEVEGFRGIGAKAQLDLVPGPGLTLVVGRNGSGKSSFAEGLEYALTGDTLRWANRKPIQEWRSGWKNLHTSGPVHLAATLTVEGEREPVVVARHWKADAGLDGDELTVRRGVTPLSGLDALSWTEPLATSRPFLSYNELAHALDAGPSVLFDALESLLGLEDVADARQRIVEAKKVREKAIKSVKDRVKELLALLDGVDDPRAAACIAALKGRIPDFDALTAAVLGDEGVDPDAELAVLRRLADTVGPDADQVVQVVDELRTAVDAQSALASTSAAADLQVAELLEQAVAWRQRSDGSDCPVCESPGVLGPAWQVAASERASALKSAAREVSDASTRVAKAVEAAKQLVRRVALPAEHELSGEARAAREAWGALPDGPAALAAHIESHFDPLQAAFAELAVRAGERVDRLQASWRPVQQRLAGWLDDAVDAYAEEGRVKQLKQAEGWMKQVESDLRDEMFEPIAAKAQETWTHLRQQSNVDLAGVELAGSSTRRRVSLNVTIDGTQGIALGVMSQGELHALALSLFLPRLTRPDSPFRFVVIDDPVQAMDPAKVDGLARVLEDAAKTHQVVVFTHDSRLPEATRRLGIGCRVVEVRRRPDSRVELKDVADPVSQYIQDAFHVKDQAPELGDEIARRVVPGLCRLAVEAGCKERAWRDLLKAGASHARVEEEIEECRSMQDLATLALFGDRNRGADLLPRLNAKAPWAADAFQRMKRHAHEPLPPGSDLRAFILDAERLANGFRT